MFTRCVRLSTVCRIISGSSLTSRNTVPAGGSSSIFSILFAVAAFMRSGSQIIITFRPPSLELSDIFCCIMSLSCW